MNKLYQLFLALLLLSISPFLITSCTSPNKDQQTDSETDMSSRYRSMIYSSFAEKAHSYHADTKYLLLVDYSIPSNHARLFVWDSEVEMIVDSFWCAHGLGGGSTAEKPVFSNTLGSNCSSLGWFKVERGVGVSAHYGYQYHAIDGLEDCNSNARRRQLLIHPWWSVSEDEEAQIPEPMNLDYRCAGCFTTSARGFEAIDRYVKSRSKPLLLYAINGLSADTE